MRLPSRYLDFAERYKWLMLITTCGFIFMVTTEYVMVFTWLSPIFYPAFIFVGFSTLVSFFGKIAAIFGFILFISCSFMDFYQVNLWRKQVCEDLKFYSNIGNAFFERNINISTLEDCEKLCKSLMFGSFPSITLRKDLFNQIFGVPLSQLGKNNKGYVLLELTRDYARCTASSLTQEGMFQSWGEADFCLVWSVISDLPDGTLLADVQISSKGFWASTYQREQRSFSTVDAEDIAQFEMFELETKALLPMHHMLMYPEKCPAYFLDRYFSRKNIDEEEIVL